MEIQRLVRAARDACWADPCVMLIPMALRDEFLRIWPVAEPPGGWKMVAFLGLEVYFVDWVTRPVVVDRKTWEARA